MNSCAEIADFLREIDAVTELPRKAVFENARAVVDQEAWSERNNGQLKRHRYATERVDKLDNERRARISRAYVFEKVIIVADGTLTFRFENGFEIKV